MSAEFIVHFMGVVPIPVGHAVEIRVFIVDTAVFGTKLEPMFDEPLIIDLDTGVIYGEASHFGEEKAMTSINVVQRELPLSPRSDLQEHGRWRGRVTANRIAWLGSKVHRFQQTSLNVAADPSEQPYR